MGSDTPASSRTSSLRTIVLLAVLVVVIALAIYLRTWHWLPQDEAKKRAVDFIDHAHPGLEYQSTQSWKKWDGHWLVQFESNPPITVNVDRKGECKAE